MDRSIPLMNDSEIQARVESLAGKNARILDCEKKSSLITEEVLLLNGEPVRLVGETGAKIKDAMKAGEPLPPEILSEILLQTGIQAAPVQVETVTTVKSNTKTSEVSTLTDARGQLVDEKMNEFEEDDEYESTNVEVWEKEPQQLMDQMESEKNRMWDFYKSNNVQSPQSGKQSTPKSTIFSNMTEQTSKQVFSSKSNNEVPRTKSPLSYYSNGKMSDDSLYETPIMSPEGFRNGSSPVQSYSPQRVPDREYVNVGSPKSPPSRPPPPIPSPKLRHPGKMPPLSLPADPKLRPPIPPKPSGIRLAASGYTGNLRTDKNISLPVRVVYETFI